MSFVDYLIISLMACRALFDFVIAWATRKSHVSLESKIIPSIMPVSNCSIVDVNE